jgi:predicted DNA-binding transcriptional regulator AlpA
MFRLFTMSRITKDGRRARGKSATYEDIAKGLFPPGIPVGRQTKAWPEYEIDILNAATIAEQSEEEVRDLVKALVKARSNLVFDPETIHGLTPHEIAELVSRNLKIQEGVA